MGEVLRYNGASLALVSRVYHLYKSVIDPTNRQGHSNGPNGGDSLPFIGKGRMANRTTSRIPNIETEESLIGRIRLRDQDALAEIYDRFALIVYSIALRVLRKQSAAEEVLQEVFLDVWRNPDDYDHKRGPLWVRLVLAGRNRAIDRLRQRRSKCALDDVAIASCVNFGDSAERKCTVHQVRRAMKSLSHRQRRALELCFFDGLIPIEITGVTGDHLDVVNTNIRNALLLIRNAVNSSADHHEH